MADEKNIKERVELITTRNFTISACPEKVFQRFVSFCKQETNNNYAMGIKLLLDVYEKNAKELVLYEKLLDHEDRLIALEEAVFGKKEKKKIPPKTMGSGSKSSEGGDEDGQV